jgi:broad specificity phosphatase PhoE
VSRVGNQCHVEDILTARLTLIAHAATEAQRHAAFPLDEPITEREAAKIAALRWKAPRTDHVWSAPEQRTQQTSSALGLTAAITDGLRDCDYAAWRGRKMDEVQSEDPEGLVRWLTDPSAAPHGGESIEQVIGRVGLWMNEQLQINHTIAVTHPAVIRAAIVYALHFPAQQFWRIDVAPLTLTELYYSREMWTIRCVGCALNAQEQSDQDQAER